MIAGTLLAWVTTMLGLGGVMKPSEVGLALQQFGIRPPIPGADKHAPAVILALIPNIAS